MSPLPTGTLTLLFSDIEGSTLLLNRLGERWGEALSAQRTILRRAFAKYGGHEMGTEGDSFFVVFSSAHEALLAAQEAQRGLHEHKWPDGTALKVRMGLHTGEPERHEDGYIGMDIHRAARIAATASGGQIVLSAATHQLVAGQLKEANLRDLGWHRLKDLAEPEHLYDLVVPGLPDAFAPLRSLGARANLPTYATEMVGRSTELADLRSMIESGARLVTLTGPGGTGKTRAAVAAATELHDALPWDVFFVPLDTADRAALMWAGIAEAVGVPADAEEPPQDRALRFLRDRASLLVLDNLEQIPDADAVVGRLLSDAPLVRVLATSRRPLHLVAENEYPLSPLSVPVHADVDRAQAEESGAVNLFVRRARMVRPSFSLTDDNVGDVVALCHRLDGLPLAIELAAARSKLLTPRALLSRIDERLGDGVTASDRAYRQRTLGATIAWSYDLLDEHNQRVFRALGVFASSVGLEAIESVAGSGADDPLDVVAHLVDVSLVQILDGPDGEPMISMLETIRRFARERLESAGEYDDVRLRHARWCLQAAKEISELLHGPTQMSALDRMGAIEDNVRAALDWCLQPGVEARDRRECGYALLAPMNRYWYRFGYVAEGRGWHDRALRSVEGDDSEDSFLLLDALHGMGILALQQNDLVPAMDALERALEMARRLGDVDREARECNSLGIAHRESGNVEEALSLVKRSYSLAQQIKSPNREVTALTNLVTLSIDAGDYVAAVAAARKAITADRAREDPWGVAINQVNLVMALLNSEGPQRAYDQIAEVAVDAVALEDLELSIDVLESFAAVLSALGDAETAATLLGASDHHRHQSGMPRTQPDQAHLDRFILPAKRSLAAQTWDRSYADGTSMSIETALAHGLAQEPAALSLTGTPGKR